MKHLDKRDTESLESNLSLERHWQLDGGWHRTVFIRYLLENYRQGLQDDNSQFLLPGMTYTRTRTRSNSGLLTWGDKQTITLEYGDQHCFQKHGYCVYKPDLLGYELMHAITAP